MFRQCKHLNASHLIVITAVFAIASCGPVADANNPSGIDMAHDDMVKNFANNAFACYSPIANNDAINCRAVSRFAHYTMTFIDVQKANDGFIKIQYKIRFDEKSGFSCFNHASVNPEKITIYNSLNNAAVISDDDVENNDPKMVEILKNQIIARETPLGEVCYKYKLFTTNDPKMMYQIRADEYKNGTPTGKVENIAMFSNGSKAFIAQ